MDAQSTVCAGQFYSQKLTHWSSHCLVWRVKSVSNTAMDLPHALLINVRDPLEIRTVSCRTLINRAFYERLENRGSGRPVIAAANESQPKRAQGAQAAVGTAP